jgi:hypothetical protein
MPEGSVGLEGVEHHPFESVALVVLIGGDRPDIGQDLLDRRH